MNTTIEQSAPGAAAAPVAAPAPMPAPAPAPMPAAPMPMYADGGEMGDSGKSGGGIKGFFNDINIVDIAISAFIVGGVIYAIQYYKFMMMIEKTGYADLSARIQKLESAAQAAKKIAEANASGNSKSRRPVMRLG
jgi:hypothetical protein